MADNEKDVIIDIKVKYEDAFKQIGKLKTENEELRGLQAKLKEELKDGKITREEYNKSLAATEAQYKNNASGIKILEKEVQNNLKYEQAQLGSREKLRAELALNVAALDKLSEAERNSTKGDAFIRQIDETNAKLKEIEESYGDHRRSVGDYEKATRSLKSELKGMVDQLAQMRLEGKDTTPEFQEMQKAAAKLSDTIGDTKQAISNLAKDTSQLEGFNQGVQTLVGSFGMYKSVLGLTDTENEHLADTMKSLQIVMAALASATALQNALQKQSGLMLQIATIQTKAKTAAEALSTKGTMIAIVQQKILNAVASANPYVILALALISVVGAIAIFSSKTETAAEAQKRLNEQQEIYLDHLERESKKIIDVATERESAINRQIKLLEAMGGKQKEIAALEEERISIQREAIEGRAEIYKEEIKNLDENQKKLENFSNSLDRLRERAAAGEKTVLVRTEFGKIEKQKIEDVIDYTQGQVDFYGKSVSVALEVKSDTAQIENEAKIAAAKQTKASADAAKEYQAKLKDQKAKERETIRAAEDAALALVKDGIEKQRQTVNQSYDRQIEDLKRRLAEEKNLTAAAKDAINATIIDLDKKRDAELEQLTDEATARRIAKETERINLLLEATKAGTQQEFDARRQLIEQNRQADILANNALTEEMRQSEADINAKYDMQAATLREQQTVATAQKQSEAVRLEWENRLLQVQQGSMEEYALKVQTAQAEYDFLVNLDAEQKAAMFESDLAYTNAVLENKKKLKDAIKDVVQSEQDAVQKQLEATSKIASSMSDLFGAIAGDNEALAGFSKALAIVSILLDTQKAIAAAVAAGAGKPFPANLAAIAMGVAAVTSAVSGIMSQVKSAKTPKAPKFATGGTISGAGSGSSDSIQAFLSNGESVNTAQATSMFAPLYSALNQIGGGVPIAATQAGNQVMGEDILARAFAKAVSTLPNPIVSVEEIDSVKTTVTAYETLRLQ